jgi:hypothetical protein
MYIYYIWLAIKSIITFQPFLFIRETKIFMTVFLLITPRRANAGPGVIPFCFSVREDP